MEPTPPVSFARLLRRYRLESRLTQEALAKRARLSREAVSALERGERQYRARTRSTCWSKRLGSQTRIAVP